jgi:hypothetical protein
MGRPFWSNKLCFEKNIPTKTSQSVPEGQISSKNGRYQFSCGTQTRQVKKPRSKQKELADVLKIKRFVRDEEWIVTDNVLDSVKNM